MGIASLVIGLVLIIGGLLARFGMPMGHLPFGLIIFANAGSIYSIPLSVVGMVLGIIAVRRKSRRGIAIAGLVLNALVVLFVIVVLIVWSIQGD